MMSAPGADQQMAAEASPYHKADQPFTPTAAKPRNTVQPTVPAGGPTKNISSDELEEGEVHQIAAELKQQLDTPKAPEPQLPPKPKPKAKTEHTAKLEEGEGDTIVIDRDGSFHSSDEKKK
jgi:hypothetical protein